MAKHGFDLPAVTRKTYLYELEETWYLPLLARKRGLPLQAVKRSNFGEYDMAVNYLTSVLEEAAAINTLAVYNIDHMAQIRFWGKDAPELLDRALAGKMSEMKVGACKYTLLLNEDGGVQDDMILMRLAEDEYIAVINAGHDITDHVNGQELIADIDRVMACKLDGEEVEAADISDQLVKVDIQGPLSYKLIRQIYGAEVLKNRHQPEKNMNYFSFNEFERDGARYLISRTGYTNRWGWELYLPVEKAAADFKQIVSQALDLGGLLVGLGGRDENRISAGPFGLPLMGSEYDPRHTPINAPLFDAAVDMDKPEFVGKSALEQALASDPRKALILFVAEGIASHRRVYKDGVCLGTVTSSINSPNLSLEQRLALDSQRRNVNAEDGNAAIGLAWLYANPFARDDEGKYITRQNDAPIRIPVQLFRLDETGNATGSPLAGYLTMEGVSPATAPKPLKNIENL
ncbi:MAG: aminomethyl transferase family protein [Candidatus Cloacimonetes bacterium]|nr:aminomethyl transferase family protein [Candidatus Cloacimonadota bacterium]